MVKVCVKGSEEWKRGSVRVEGKRVKEKGERKGVEEEGERDRFGG